MGQGSGAQGTSRGFNQLKKGHEAMRVTLPFRQGAGSGMLIDNPL